MLSAAEIINNATLIIRLLIRLLLRLILNIFHYLNFRNNDFRRNHIFIINLIVILRVLYDRKK